MICGAWRYVGASVRGTSHERTGLPCQDASEIRCVGAGADGPVLVLACADGAGSAELATEGARLACSVIVEEASRFVAEGGSVARMDDGMLPFWFERAAESIRVQAESIERAPRDFACTLLVALLDGWGAAFAQLGDGVIVAGDGSAYRPVFWPQSGEYANMTYFITEEAHLGLVQVEVRPEPVAEVALLTDGLQMLALRFSERVVHDPFFTPMFGALRQQGPGEADDLHGPLGDFLSSAPVNARTDDDKTLLLATRLEVRESDGATGAEA